MNYDWLNTMSGQSQFIPEGDGTSTDAAGGGNANDDTGGSDGKTPEKIDVTLADGTTTKVKVEDLTKVYTNSDAIVKQTVTKQVADLDAARNAEYQTKVTTAAQALFAKMQEDNKDNDDNADDSKDTYTPPAINLDDVDEDTAKAIKGLQDQLAKQTQDTTAMAAILKELKEGMPEGMQNLTEEKINEAIKNASRGQVLPIAQTVMATFQERERASQAEKDALSTAQATLNATFEHLNPETAQDTLSKVHQVATERFLYNRDLRIRALRSNSETAPPALSIGQAFADAMETEIKSLQGMMNYAIEAKRLGLYNPPVVAPPGTGDKPPKKFDSASDALREM